MKKLVGFMIAACMIVLCSCGSAGFSKPTKYDSVNTTGDITLSVKENSLSDTGLVLFIQNNTQEELAYGVDYVIEQLKEDEWFSMDGEMSFIAIGVVLEPGSTNELEVTWEKKLSKGTYRVMKPVYVSEGNGIYAVEFVVD